MPTDETRTAPGGSTALLKKLQRAPSVLYHNWKRGRSRRAYPENEPFVAQAAINGYKLLVFANEDVGREILFNGQYERLDADFLARQIRPTDVCFDIGANVGYYTMLLATRATSGEVHAFEPVPINLHLLQAGILLNDLRNVRVNDVLLGNEVKEIEFSQSMDGGFSSMIPTGRKGEYRKITARMQTLDGYLAEHGMRRIDVVKMDVEGAEKAVLEGGLGLLRDPDHRPRVAMIELVEENLASFGVTLPGMVDFMEGLGYRPFIFDKDLLRPVPYQPDAHAHRYSNVFFTPNPALFEV